MITVWRADFAARQVFEEVFDRQTPKALQRANFSLKTRDTSPWISTNKTTQWWSYHETEREAVEALASWLAIQLVKNEQLCKRISDEYIALCGRLSGMGRK